MMKHSTQYSTPNHFQTIEKYFQKKYKFVLQSGWNFFLGKKSNLKEVDDK